MKISILIADDHKLVREAWQSFLNSIENFEVVGITGDANEAVDFSRIHKPDIILMDINLSPFSGLEATQKIISTQPNQRIIGVSIYSETSCAKKMFQMGARGYVTKNSAKAEMAKAINEVYNGRKYICDDIKNSITETLIEGLENDHDISKLTSRELEVIDLVRQGKSSKEISELLFIALKTAEVHRHNILKKLNLPNSSALVNFMNSAKRYF